MKSIILVGGEGTRLRPLTYEMPKQMLPLLGVPMIERVVSFLASHGVTSVVLSLGYLPDRFIAAYPDGRISGIPVTYVTESEPLDTAGAIRYAATEAGVDDTFVIVNGDILTNLDLTKLVAFHRERGAEATIALHPVDDPSRYGVVATDERGRVESFVEKPTKDLAPSNLINAGVYVFEPSVLQHIAPQGRVSVERHTFPLLAEAGTLYAMADDEYWLDTGTPLTYLQSSVDLLSDPRSPGVDQGNWIHPGASVHPSATIQHSAIDKGCQVSADVVITRSILLPGVTVGAGARLHQSLVGSAASIGEGARLDPVCVVGAHYSVEPGTHFEGDARLSVI